MLRHRLLILACICALFTAATAYGQVAVTTQHNDNYRTGQNSNETILTTANINVKQFGKLFSQPVDGAVYAQPLYVPNVNIAGGTHNVIYVATQHDSVYAFDADSDAGVNSAPLWQVSFINPSEGITSVSSRDVSCTDIVPEIGITSTPVIDYSTGTLYVVAKTKENGKFVQRLHALDVTNGSEKFGGPVVIQAQVKGTGDGGATVTFDPLRQGQRPGLLLQNGLVYVAWASHCDVGTYHGWLMSYDARTLHQTSVWNSTPNGGLGGFWQSGAGIAEDMRNTIYLPTGNGTFDLNKGGKDYGDSIIKFRVGVNGHLQAADYFTPHDQNYLNNQDLDLGSGGVLLIPDRPGAKYPRLLVQAGKDGDVYVIDRNHLGHFNPNNDNQIVQHLNGAVGGMWATPAFWNDNVYFGGAGDTLRAFSFSPVTGLLSKRPTSRSSTYFNFPGTTPSISANGNTNGIVWSLQTENYHGGGAVLHAYDATDLSLELYNTKQNTDRDAPGAAVKFTVPTIANGKVYVGTRMQVSVYGLLGQ